MRYSTYVCNYVHHYVHTHTLYVYALQQIVLRTYQWLFLLSQVCAACQVNLEITFCPQMYVRMSASVPKVINYVHVITHKYNQWRRNGFKGGGAELLVCMPIVHKNFNYNKPSTCRPRWFLEIAFVRNIGMSVCMHACVCPQGYKLHSCDIETVQPAEQICCI